MKFASIIAAACVFFTAAHAETIEIPADEIGWVSDRNPYETPRAARGFFHNPAVVSATGLTGVEIDIRSSGGENYYELRLMPAPDAERLTGELAFAVDGETKATKTLSVMGRGGRDDTPLVKAMAAGEQFTVTLPDGDQLSMPLAGFSEALMPADANADQTGAMRSTSIGNQCVQRQGGFSYLCACISHEYVVAYGEAGPAGAFDAADTTCRANIEANPLLGELTIQEALLGARLEAADDPADGARIGALSKDGPAYAVGMRTGDIVTKAGSAPGERLLQAKPARPGVTALTIYSPSTEETRVVRVPNALPPADIEMKTYAQFSAAAHAEETAPEPAEEPEAAAEPAPAEAAAAPVAEKVSYADPIGESCANDTLLSGLYDCACIAEQAGPARAAIADQQLESQKPLIPRREAAVAQARKALAEATTENQKKSAEGMLKRAEESLRQATTRPALSDISESSLGLRVYQGKSCKLGDYIRDKEVTECKAAASRMSGVSDVESYCACSGEKIAQAWLASEKGYSSKFAVSAATAARLACR